jgi:hypothetical protein
MFKRDSVWVWFAMQAQALAQLAPGCKGDLLVKHYGTKGLWLYTLSAKELGATGAFAEWLEAPENYNNVATIEAWHRLIDKAFRRLPYKWALHCGACNRVAPHVIAGARHHIPQLGKNPERRKRIKDNPRDRRRAFGYLTSKCAPTERQVRAFRKDVKKLGGVRGLPQHAGYRHMAFVQKRVKKPVWEGLSEKVYKVMDLAPKTPFERSSTGLWGEVLPAEGAVSGVPYG